MSKIGIWPPLRSIRCFFIPLAPTAEVHPNQGLQVFPKSIECSEDALQFPKSGTNRRLSSIHGVGDLIDVSTHCPRLRQEEKTPFALPRTLSPYAGPIAGY